MVFLRDRWEQRAVNKRMAKGIFFYEPSLYRFASKTSWVDECWFGHFLIEFETPIHRFWNAGTHECYRMMWIWASNSIESCRTNTNLRRRFSIQKHWFWIHRKKMALDCTYIWILEIPAHFAGRPVHWIALKPSVSPLITNLW